MRTAVILLLFSFISCSKINKNFAKALDPDGDVNMISENPENSESLEEFLEEMNDHSRDSEELITIPLLPTKMIITKSDSVSISNTKPSFIKRNPRTKYKFFDFEINVNLQYDYYIASKPAKGEIRCNLGKYPFHNLGDYKTIGKVKGSLIHFEKKLIFGEIISNLYPKLFELEELEVLINHIIWFLPIKLYFVHKPSKESEYSNSVKIILFEKEPKVDKSKTKTKSKIKTKKREVLNQDSITIKFN